jgi:anthranilate synthase component 1
VGVARRVLRRRLDVPGEALLALAAADPDRYPVLFDSASSGPMAQRSVLVAANGESLALDRFGQLWRDGHREPGGFLDALESWWQRVSDRDRRSPSPSDAPDPVGWHGGFAVFLGYELASEIEASLRLPSCNEPWRAWALRTPAALVHELETGTVWACAERGAESWLDRLEVDATRAMARPVAERAASLPQWRVIEEDPARFLRGVQRTLQHIAAGDVYQLNLSRGWRAALPPGVPPQDCLAVLYGALRSANPAPFAALARWGGLAILSSSPERLLRIEAGIASTRPIAGTRPRGQSAERDAALAAELRANAKERAEHVMLIDLERNDLGRVCVAGSVEVREFMAIESYAHVHHIVSEVAGRVRGDVSPVRVLAAMFPGGTITGCPKLRCMQLIGAIETEGRGAYTGSVGQLGLDGSADFSILIRTLTAHNGELHWRAGAGIVADSVPERELEETRAKARGLLHAVEQAAAPAPGRRPGGEAVA